MGFSQILHPGTPEKWVLAKAFIFRCSFPDLNTGAIFSKLQFVSTCLVMK